jgi:hypothetical protein
MFVGALRIDDLRRTIETAATPPVLLATVRARQVVDRIWLPTAGIIGRGARPDSSRLLRL